MADKTTAFTGPVVVGLNDKKGEIRLTDGKNVNEAKYLSIAAPDTITSDTTLTFPNGAGTAGQILSTDGSGNLSWVNDSAGNPDGTNGQVQFNDNGTFGAIPDGASGQVLKSNGAGVAPSFQDDSEGIPGGTVGQTQVNDGAGGFAGISEGTSGQVLTSNGVGSAATFQNAPDPATIDIDSSNVFISDNPAPSKTTAINNTGVGVNALASITNAAENVAIGQGAVQNKSTTGSGAVTAVGFLAMTSTTTGGSNTAVGRRCQSGNTTGSNNTAMGDRALSNNNADSNTAIGNLAMRNNVSGQQNTVVGDNAGVDLTGNSNTAVGFEALKNSGTSSPSGDENTAIGKLAGANISSGFRNAILGCNAGTTMNAFGGVAIGYQAGSAFPHTGSQNTYVGYQAGNAHGTGNNSTMIGNQAQASAANVSNEITLGNSSIATLRCNATSISSLSDARDKKDVEDANIGLDFINDLRPVKFVWDTRDGAKKDIKEVGFIAQELDEVQQKHGVEDHLQLVLKNNPDKLEASQGKLIPILVQAIKDLKKEIDELKKA